MAHVETSRSAAVGKHNSRTTRKPIFVDMTPMVDLAFLLISFFMLTTVLEKNYAMDLNMPAIPENPMPISKSRTMTIIADKNNQLYYYNGETPDNLVSINYSQNSLRSLLIQRIAQQEAADPEKGLICLIKLSDAADYDDMVQLLDEMTTTKVPTYAIQELTEEEKTALAGIQK